MALGLTILFHALLFLLFIFMVFITPIPPFEIKPVPEIEIGLGMEGLGRKDAGGSGQHDKDIATSENKVKTAKANNTATNVVTDDSETSVSVKVNKKKKKVFAKFNKKPVQELIKYDRTKSRLCPT